MQVSWHHCGVLRPIYRPARRRVAPILAIATLAGVVQAETLYDTLHPAAYDALSSSVIGAFALFGVLVDSQVADDFSLTASYQITSVTGDFFGADPIVVPDFGFLVEFFEDLGGIPSETAVAAVLSNDFMVTAIPVFGKDGSRFTVDLSSSGISLGSGTWWVSIVAVDETPLGVNYRSLRTTNLLIGSPAHGRDGGLDHATGYQGIFGVDDWGPLVVLTGDGGDIGLRVEGDLIPGPGDVDGDGDVDIVDFLDLLAAWGACPLPCPPSCAADFDGDCAVGIVDFLTLLANWDL